MSLLNKSLVYLMFGFFISSGAFAGKQTKSSIEVVPLGKAMQISFDQKDWLFYQPKFMQPSGISTFEAHAFPKVHGFLRTEKPSSVAPNLQDLCKVLTDAPLDPSLPNNAKATTVRIGNTEACQVTKNDSTQNAIQYIFISKTKGKWGRVPSATEEPKYYLHTLYFYYPKEDSVHAEPMVAKLVKGLGSK